MFFGNRLALHRFLNGSLDLINLGKDFEIVRNKNQKTRCEKQMLPKVEGIFKSYDKVQSAGAVYLSKQEDIENIRCNVDSAVIDGVAYTTDFIYEKKDGTLAVRECVFRKLITKPKTVKLLDASRSFWMKRGVMDWGIIIDADASISENKCDAKSAVLGGGLNE